MTTRALTPEEGNAILELLIASGNATIALESLLGLYEEPEISLTPISELGYGNRKLITFESYNKFKDEVTYKYCIAKEKTAWIKKNSRELLMFSLLEGPITEWEPNAYAKELGITVEEARRDYTRIVVYDAPDETKSHTATCSYKTWMNK